MLNFLNQTFTFLNFASLEESFLWWIPCAIVQRRWCFDVTHSSHHYLRFPGEWTCRRNIQTSEANTIFSIMWICWREPDFCQSCWNLKASHWKLWKHLDIRLIITLEGFRHPSPNCQCILSLFFVLLLCLSKQWSFICSAVLLHFLFPDSFGRTAVTCLSPN